MILLALLSLENTKAERRDYHRPDFLRDVLPHENTFKVKLSPITFLTVYATTYRYRKDAGRFAPRGENDEIAAAANTLQVILVGRRSLRHRTD